MARQIAGFCATLSLPTGGRMAANLPSCDMPPMDSASEKLAEKKSADENGKSDEVPAETREDSQSNDERDRDVDRENPLHGEFAHLRAPVAERHVQEKHHEGNNPKSQGPPAGA